MKDRGVYLILYKGAFYDLYVCVLAVTSELTLKNAMTYNTHHERSSERYVFDSTFCYHVQS